MRVVCEFADLVGQSVPLLEFFYNWYNFGIISAIFRPKTCPTLTIDCEVISLLTNVFPNSSVIINTPKKYEHYGTHLSSNLTSESMGLKFISVVDYDSIGDADVYVSSCLRSMRKYSSVYDKVFIGNTISCIIFSIISDGSKHIKDKLFSGFFTMIGSCLILVYFVGGATIHLCFTSITSLMIDHFLFSFVFCVFFRFLRELLQLVDEYVYYTNGFYPRSSWPFANCSSSVFVAFILMSISFIFCLYVIIMFPNSGFLSLVTGIFYFTSFNMKFIIRIGVSFISSVVTWILCKYAL